MAPSTKILFIDDEPDNREIMELFIKTSLPEATVLSAGTLPGALELIDCNTDADLVISDMWLTRPDSAKIAEGNQIARHALSLEVPISVIVVTATPDAIADDVANRVTDVIIKARTQPDAIIAMIRSALDITS